MVQGRLTVPAKGEYEVVCALMNGDIDDDSELPQLHQITPNGRCQGHVIPF